MWSKCGWALLVGLAGKTVKHLVRLALTAKGSGAPITFLAVTLKMKNKMKM